MKIVRGEHLSVFYTLVIGIVYTSHVGKKEAPHLQKQEINQTDLYQILHKKYLTQEYLSIAQSSGHLNYIGFEQSDITDSPSHIIGQLKSEQEDSIHNNEHSEKYYKYSEEFDGDEFDDDDLKADYKFNTDSTPAWSHESSQLNLTNATKKLCEEDIEYSIYLQVICVPIIVLFGIVGNTLSFCVMCSRTYAHKSYSYYLRALAIFDTLTLLINLVNSADEICRDWMGIKTCFMDKLMVSSAGCKAFSVFEHTVMLMSSWLIVCFTIDRYIAVCHPLQLSRLCTENRSIVVTIILFIGTTISQLFRIYFIVKIPGRSQPCHAPPGTLRTIYFGLDYFWFSFFLRFLIPFIIIVICNGHIAFHIQRMRTRRQPREMIKAHQANMAITTLFLVCGVFVITMLPNSVFSAATWIAYSSGGLPVLRKVLCTLLPYDVPFQMVRLCNYSINCVLYGLTGRQFRRELRRLLYCERRSWGMPMHMVKFTHLERRETPRT